MEDDTPAVRTRVAVELGISKGQLAGPGWSAPYRGVHRPMSWRPEPSPRQRILDVAELLPEGAAIGGWAAAHLLGAVELDGRGRAGLGREPVPVILPPPVLIRAREGIRRWRSRLDPGDVVLVDGVPCTSPARTGFDLARSHPLRDGVVCLDVLGRQVGLSPVDVLDYARAHRRWRGLPRVLPAVRLADPRAASTGETRFRLVWVLDAHLPPPEVNPSILGSGGHLLGIGDLLDPEAALLGEYDGRDHRALAAHVADNAREEWLEDAGLVVVRASSPDVTREARARTVHRLRSAYRRGRARDRSRDRWTYIPLPDPTH